MIMSEQVEVIKDWIEIVHPIPDSQKDDVRKMISRGLQEINRRIAGESQLCSRT